MLTLQTSSTSKKWQSVLSNILEKVLYIQPIYIDWSLTAEIRIIKSQKLAWYDFNIHRHSKYFLQYRNVHTGYVTFLDTSENLINTTDPDPRKTCGYNTQLYIWFQRICDLPTPRSFMDPS